VAQAVSGADIALWDLVGKLRDASVADLLGGRGRQRVPVYASGVGPVGVADLVARVLDQGFTRAKCRVGFGQATDVATVGSARTLLADDQLLLDANQAWTLEEAVRLLPLLASPATPWVEEPLRDMDPGELSALFARIGIPAAAGENTYGRKGFAALAAHEAIAVVQPDVAKLGGIGELLAVCDLAADHGKPVAPRWYGGGVALAAALQVAGVHAAITEVEYDVRDNPFRDELVVGGFAVAHGEIAVPDGPGLGVVLDPDAIRRFELGGAAMAHLWETTAPVPQAGIR
jgi:L-alanine-DL-glutamate epimerase-like enolase superfamily enzyme